MTPLIERFSGVPAIACAERSELFAACLQGAISHSDFAKLQSAQAAHASTDDDFWPEPDSWLAAYRPYSVRDGILVIPVKGVLIHNFPYALGGWLTGYEYIWRAFDRGMNDANVQAIALDIESPGGEVAGNFDLVDAMFEYRGTKPIAAFANEYAYSAAYSIASVADTIYISRTGGVGSIGVVTSHMDMSKYLDKAGIVITFIHAGKFKVEGNPYEPLSDEAKARIQTRIDLLYTVFVSTVARNRGMDEAAVRATEALTYSADDAIEIGLADKVASFESAMSDFSTEVKSKGLEMSTASTEKPAAFVQSDVDAARAEGQAAGSKAERDRIKAITGCDEAKGRSAVALQLATSTGMSAEEAKGVLALMPEEKPAASGAAFEAAMAKGNPEVGAGAAAKAEDGAVAETPEAKAAAIKANYASQGGNVKTNK